MKKSNDTDRVGAAKQALAEAEKALAAHDDKKRRLDEQAARLTHDLDAATLRGDEAKADQLSERLARVEMQVGSLVRTRPQLVRPVEDARAALSEAERAAALLRQEARRDRVAQLNEESTRLWRQLLAVRGEVRRLHAENAADLVPFNLDGHRTLGRWLLTQRGDLVGPEVDEIRASIDEVRRFGLPGVPAAAMPPVAAHSV